MSAAASNVGVVVIMVLAAMSLDRGKQPQPVVKPAAPLVQPVQAAEIEPPPAKRQDQLVPFARRWEVAAMQPALPPKDEVRFIDKGGETSPIATTRAPVDVSEKVPAKTAQPLPSRRHRIVHRVRNARASVCTRHNMRKVYVRGGKSWRCRR